MELTISGEDRKALKKVEVLAKKLGLDISKRLPKAPTEKAHKEALLLLMQEMAASGGIESIKDPEAWQREIREDRSLPGRN